MKMKVLAMALGLTVMGTTPSAYASPAHYNKWVQQSGNWNFYNENGNKVTGWKLINGSWYYFNGQGIMQTGWQSIHGTWYYFNTSGAMQTDWKMINGAWYYFNESGGMQTGWQSIHSTWYYFSESGAMQTGWKAIQGSWYYFNASGAMQTNWQLIDDFWYYFDENSGMKMGWQSIGGSWYYFDADGIMQTYWVEIDGTDHFFGEDGKWNALSEYVGNWTEKEWGNSEEYIGFPDGIAVAIDLYDGNEAYVYVMNIVEGLNKAHFKGLVTFQNNKAVLQYENDGWGGYGTATIELKDGAVHINVSVENGETRGIPSGQYVLPYRAWD